MRSDTPGEYLRFTAETVEVAKRADKSLLSEIGRLFVIAQKTVDSIEYLFFVFDDQRIEVQISVGIFRRQSLSWADLCLRQSLCQAGHAARSQDAQASLLYAPPVPSPC